jgi:hypothetical protein
MKRESIAPRLHECAVLYQLEISNAGHKLLIARGRGQSMQPRHVLFQYTKLMRDGKITKTELTVGSSLIWGVALIAAALTGKLLIPNEWIKLILHLSG